MPTLKLIDPTTLTVDTNVRTKAEIGADFIASVKEHGVLTPITAHQTNGVVKVLMGQRRTLAAVEAELPTIPVILVDCPDEADRLAQQVVENDHRSALSDLDRANAVHQLALIGVPAKKIARRLATNATTVENALAVAADSTAHQYLTNGLSLDQAAALAEFSHDKPLTERLLLAAEAGPQRFDHAVTQVRRERDLQAALAAHRTHLEAQGTVVVGEDQDFLHISSALNQNGDPATEADANAVWISARYDGTIYEIAVIADPQATGFTSRYTTGINAGPMTDQEKEDRRTLIAHNKGMDAATEVRRRWVRTLLSHKTPPADWTAFVAETLATPHHRSDFGRIQDSLITEIFGTLKGGTAQDQARHMKTGHHRMILAITLASIERTIDRQSWRNPSGYHRAYLTQLVTWGYEPSAVEQIIIDPTTSHEAQ